MKNNANQLRQKNETINVRSLPEKAEIRIKTKIAQKKKTNKHFGLKMPFPRAYFFVEI